MSLSLRSLPHHRLSRTGDTKFWFGEHYYIQSLVRHFFSAAQRYCFNVQPARLDWWTNISPWSRFIFSALRRLLSTPLVTGSGRKIAIFVKLACISKVYRRAMTAVVPCQRVGAIVARGFLAIDEGIKEASGQNAGIYSV